MGDSLRFRAGKPSRHVTSHPGQLSLSVPPWVGAMSTGDGYWPLLRGENGEFCITTVRQAVTSTACILIQLIKGAGC